MSGRDVDDVILSFFSILDSLSLEDSVDSIDACLNDIAFDTDVDVGILVLGGVSLRLSIDWIGLFGVKFVVLDERKLVEAEFLLLAVFTGVLWFVESIASWSKSGKSIVRDLFWANFVRVKDDVAFAVVIGLFVENEKTLGFGGLSTLLVLNDALRVWSFAPIFRLELIRFSLLSAFVDSSSLVEFESEGDERKFADKRVSSNAFKSCSSAIFRDFLGKSVDAWLSISSGSLNLTVLTTSFVLNGCVIFEVDIDDAIIFDDSFVFSISGSLVIVLKPLKLNFFIRWVLPIFVLNFLLSSSSKSKVPFKGVLLITDELSINSQDKEALSLSSIKSLSDDLFIVEDNKRSWLSGSIEE